MAAASAHAPMSRVESDIMAIAKEVKSRSGRKSRFVYELS